MTGAQVRYERKGAVSLLTIEHPPVNALAHPVRVALLEQLRAAEADPAVRAIVITGAGAHFVAGADIREFDAEPRSPLLFEVLAAIEGAAKPVVAALHGAALGGGLELALACHYRIAAPGSSFGLPEIRLGLLPGAGGTQRLPRLIGAREALTVMLSGEPRSLPWARSAGLIDAESEASSLVAQAVGEAERLAASGKPLRRTGELPVPSPLGLDAIFIDAQRTQTQRKYPGLESIEAIIDCVCALEADRFDAGVRRARQWFERCRPGTPSRALRHLFFAERPARSGVAPRAVRTVAVLGAGTMGSGITLSLATAGYQVVLIDADARALEAGSRRFHETLSSSVEKGKLEPHAAQDAAARVTATVETQALEQADAVIEAVFESLAIKREVFAMLGARCKPGAVLASNTSTLDINALAAASGRPADVLGMHFFSPAHIMRLVEIVRGRDTSESVIATARDITRRMGKLGILVGNCFGFVGNRMLYAYGGQNQLLLLEGATPARVDEVLERFGMAMGPNAVGDLAGLDVGYRIRRERADRPSDPRYYRIADLLVEAGRLGQKSGRGAYLYPAGARKRVPDPEVDALIEAEAQRLGITRREISDTEVLERCLYALINEGARLLGEGIAASPSDVDAIWCNGYGFPRFRGGPLFYADTVGLAQVVERLRHYARELGNESFTPAPLLQDLAAQGATFNDWQQRRRPPEEARS
jgi:3-hydroxyacyl-CoA dehydrogenase